MELSACPHTAPHLTTLHLPAIAADLDIFDDARLSFLDVSPLSYTLAATLEDADAGLLNPFSSAPDTASPDRQTLPVYVFGNSYPGCSSDGSIGTLPSPPLTGRSVSTAPHPCSCDSLERRSSSSVSSITTPVFSTVSRAHAPRSQAISAKPQPEVLWVTATKATRTRRASARTHPYTVIKTEEITEESPEPPAEKCKAGKQPSSQFRGVTRHRRSGRCDRVPAVCGHVCRSRCPFKLHAKDGCTF